LEAFQVASIHEEYVLSLLRCPTLSDATMLVICHPQDVSWSLLVFCHGQAFRKGISEIVTQLLPGVIRHSIFIQGLNQGFMELTTARDLHE